MTRINTNVSSLNAQKTLARSNSSLQESLTRLSTGLRINAGKDDPAGLIASEILRADIVSVQRAITNSNRANQMIATADSALGQVSSLLNDIRGLISEGANTGAMSDEQIAANQLQIDSSLEAIDRISQVTQFQGRRLLDGNLDFLTEGISTAQITDMTIEQANFGAQNEIDVSVAVTSQATQASLNYGFGAVANDVVLEVGGKDGFEAFSFAAGSTIQEMAAAINLVSDSLGLTAEVETGAQTGAVTVSSFGGDNDITITANTAGEEGGDVRVKYTAGTAGIEANYGFTATPGDALAAGYTEALGTAPAKLDVTLETEDWERASYVVEATGDNNDFAIVAQQAGAAANGFKVTFTEGVAAASASFNGTTLTIDVMADGSSTAAQVVTAINALTNPLVSSVFKATLLHEGDGSGAGVLPGGAEAMGVVGTSYDFTGGYDGGTVKSTANEVVAAINDTTGDAAEFITAALAGTDDGHEAVTAFQEFAFHGTAAANDYLQFLGLEDTRNVRFVANDAGSGLEVDFSSVPRVEGYSKAVVQQTAAEATFEIEARNKGAEYDGVTVVIATNGIGDKTQDYVEYDETSKTLTFSVGIGFTTAQDLVNYVNAASSPVSGLFRARAFGTSALTALANAVPSGDAVTTSGGIVTEGTVVVKLATDTNGLITTTADDLVDFFNTDYSVSDPTLQANLAALGMSVANIGGSDGSGILAATTTDLTFATSGTDLQDYAAVGTSYAVNGVNARLAITAVNPGSEYDDVVIEFEDTADHGSETFSYDSVLKKLTIGIDSDVSTVDEIKAAWAKLGVDTEATYDPELFDLFTMADGGGGDGSDAVTISDSLTLIEGVKDDGYDDGAALLGNEDSAAIGLNFNATEYGSNAFVSVKALNGTTFAVTNSAGTAAERSVGTDIDARINGIQAIGEGLKASLNTSALDLNFSVASTVASGTTMNFSITGGGAQFQLGPDVVSNQQARMGITSVNTAKLGGTAGRLFELRSGNAKSLKNDVSGAASVAEQVITQIVNLRGRLGAFQRTTLDSNIAALSDTLEALTSAESDIRDADFAAESANLTRAQVLVQSGLSVLSIANSNPQSVLSLLR